MPEEQSKEVDSFSLSPKVMVLLFMFLHFCLTLEDGFFPTVLDEVRDFFDISYVLGGVLGTGYYIGMCVATPVFGYVANFMPPTKILLFGMLIWLSSLVVLIISENYYEVLIFRFTLGVGKAAFVSLAPVIIDLIAEPRRRSMSVAMYFGAGPIGFSLGHILGGLIIDNNWYDVPDLEKWRIVYVFQAIIGVVAVLLFLFIRGPKNILALGAYKGLEDNSGVWQKLKKLSHNWTWMFCTAAFGFQNFIVAGSGFYLIQFIIDIYGQGTTTAGIILGAITLVSVIFGNLLGGASLDWVLQKQKNSSEIEMCATSILVTILWMVILIPPGLGLVFIPQLPLFCVVLFVAMLLLWMGSGPLNTSILWSVELKERTFSRSISNVTLFLFGYAPAPIVLGALKVEIGWIWTFFWTFCLAILLVLLMFAAYYSQRKVIRKFRKGLDMNYQTTGDITGGSFQGS